MVDWVCVVTPSRPWLLAASLHHLTSHFSHYLEWLCANPFSILHIVCSWVSCNRLCWQTRRPLCADALLTPVVSSVLVRPESAFCFHVLTMTSNFKSSNWLSNYQVTLDTIVMSLNWWLTWIFCLKESLNSSKWSKNNENKLFLACNK